jgi:hypothetical protein
MARIKDLTLIGQDPTTGLLLNKETIVKIGMPGAWDTSDLWVEERQESTRPWRFMFDEFGDRRRFPVEANGVYDIDPSIFIYSREVRFRSANSQSTTRTIEIFIAERREIYTGASA